MNGSPMLRGIRSMSSSEIDFWGGGWAAIGPLSEAPTPGRIRFVRVRPMIMATSVLSR